MYPHSQVKGGSRAVQANGSAGFRWLMASALCFALNWSYGPSDTSSTDNIEVISQTRFQPTYSNYSLIYKQTASRATTNSLLILNSVYKKHMWHLKTFRKQTKKSSLLSPPCLDGTAAFPNSKTAPMKRVMPWDGWGGAGAALAPGDSEERQGLPVDVLTLPLFTLQAPGTGAALVSAISHVTATASAASDLPALRLTSCWWAGGAQGWEILLQTTAVSSFVLRMLLQTSWAEIPPLFLFASEGPISLSKID